MPHHNFHKKLNDTRKYWFVATSIHIKDIVFQGLSHVKTPFFTHSNDTGDTSTSLQAESLTTLCNDFVKKSEPYTQKAKQAGCYADMPFWQANSSALDKWCLNTNYVQMIADISQFQTIDRLHDIQDIHKKSFFVENILKQRQFELNEYVNTKFL